MIVKLKLYKIFMSKEEILNQIKFLKEILKTDFKNYIPKFQLMMKELMMMVGFSMNAKKIKKLPKKGQRQSLIEF